VSQAGGKRRILIIDDSEAIHVDFRRVLTPEKSVGQGELDTLEEEIFGAPSRAPTEPEFEVDTVFQGQEAVARVRQALAEGRPYALLFLDYQMPPGWNGMETLRQLRKVAPTVPVVFFSAYSDYSWEEITREFGASPLLVELRKPFNSMEMRRLALTLSESAAGAAPARS
jgi:CheY-like chemotaxis protein